MTDEVAEIAYLIMNDVLVDLHGRKGVGNELDEIDPYIYDELKDDLFNIIFEYCKELADLD